MISEGPRLEKFRTLAEHAALSNVLFLPYQDRDRLAYSLSAGDVHIVTNKKGLGGLRVPGKTYGVLAVGRPIVYIGEPRCEVADLVRDHRAWLRDRRRGCPQSRPGHPALAGRPRAAAADFGPGQSLVRSGLPSRAQY